MEDTMRRALYIGLTVMVVCGIGIGSYFSTRHFVYKEAYSKGTANGFRAGHTKGYNDGFNAGSNTVEMCPADPFHIYSVCPSSSSTMSVIPTVVSPSHCSSYTYGVSSQFTDTNCN